MMRRSIFLFAGIFLTVAGALPVVSGIQICHETGLTCYHSQPPYEPGDLFYFDIRCCNGDAYEDVEADLYIILDVYGQYFFWPSWSGYDYETILIPACSCIDMTIFEFVIPDGSGTMDGIEFIGYMIIDGVEYPCRYVL